MEFQHACLKKPKMKRLSTHTPLSDGTMLSGIMSTASSNPLLLFEKCVATVSHGVVDFGTVWWRALVATILSGDFQASMNVYRTSTQNHTAYQLGIMMVGNANFVAASI